MTARFFGLHHDYLSLGGADRGQVRGASPQCAQRVPGVALVTTKVQIRFHEIEGLEVCQVDVEPASQPVVVVARDKNGQKVEKFYVRSGNASHEMPMSEMSGYVKERFR